MTTSELTAGAACARVLVAAGVEEVFGIIGGKLTPLLAGIAEEPELRWVGTRHEAAGAWMATGVGAATGRLAACVAETGPGVFNVVGGLLTARSNNIGVLVVTSANPMRAGRRGRGMLMSGDGLAVLSEVTKWSARVTDAASVVEVLHDAVRQATSGRPGPVHVEIPADVLAARANFDDVALDAPCSSFMAKGRPAGDPRVVAEAASVLARASHPLLIAGGGVVTSDASEEFRQLARMVGAASTATQMGVGVVSTEDPAFIGHGGVMFSPPLRRALREADVIVAVGCRFSSWLWEGGAPAVGSPGEQTIIQIDSDPTAIGALVPLGVGIQGDARAVLGQVIDQLGPINASSVAAEPDGGLAGVVQAPSAWLTSLIEEYQAYRDHLRGLGHSTGEAIHPAELAVELGRLLPADAFVVYDGGHTTFWSSDLTPALAPRTRFGDPGAAHLGFGVPFAHALSLIHPGRPVFNITGDGAFGFSLAELDTARRQGLPVIHVIHNNESWGVIRQAQKGAGFELGSALEGTDYAAVARGFGCHGETIKELGDLEGALKRSLASGLPAVVDVRVSFDPHPGMALFASAGRS